MRTLRWGFPAALALTVVAAVFLVQAWHSRKADPSAVEILFRAERAIQRTSYTAAVESVVENGTTKARSIAELRAAPGGRRRVRYTQGDLKGAVHGSDGSAVWRFDPKASRVLIGSQVCSGGDGLLLTGHRARLEREDVVAGRPAYVVSLSGYGEGRVRRRYFIDKETFIPLGTDEYSPTGRLVSRTRFLSVRFTPQDPKVFEAPQVSGVPVVGDAAAPTRCGSLEELSRRVGYKAVPPRYVPEGMRLVGYYYHLCPCCKRAAPVMRYSDRASSLTVFQCSPGCQNDAEWNDRAFWGGTLLRVQTRWGHYILVGDIPEAEMKKVAASLAR
ncbi:MAG: hypothetical protein ACUVRO_03120 [Armatimonadota bacterium]